MIKNHLSPILILVVIVVASLPRLLWHEEDRSKDLPGKTMGPAMEERSPSAAVPTMADWLPEYDSTDGWGEDRRDCTECHNMNGSPNYFPRNHENPHHRIKLRCLQCHQPHPSHLAGEKSLFEVADPIHRKRGESHLPVTLRRITDWDQRCSACHLEQYQRIYGAEDGGSRGDGHVHSAQESKVPYVGNSFLQPLKVEASLERAKATFVKGRLCIGCHYADHSFRSLSEKEWDQTCLQCHGGTIQHVQETGWGCVRCHMAGGNANWLKKPLGHSL